MLRLATFLLLLAAAAPAAGAHGDGYDTVRPLFERYCWSCHGDEEPEGGLDLSRVDPADPHAAGRVWRAVLMRMEAGEMPPRKRRQPTVEERQALLGWIAAERARAPRDPGRVTLHRLNRSEYDNTLRDLLGLDLRLAGGFPADDVGDGFDNSAETLTLPPLLFEKYLAAAETAVEEVWRRQDARARLVIAEPVGAAGERGAARVVVAAFAERAFRRPPTDAAVEALLGPYDAARAQGDGHEPALRAALVATLVSPRFLFRVEEDRGQVDADGAHRLDGWEMASRLSYFLWSTMPDAELLAAARAGELDDPVHIAGQARRMLMDGRSQAFIDNFAGQWLQLRRLDAVAPDRERFPEFDERLRVSMREEALRFFAAIVRDDRPILELIHADFTFLDERLARHYGIPGVKGERMRRVALPDGRRGGVLSLASTLTITANPTRTSPVKRGKWVLEQILGSAPPPPPPMVGEIGDEPVVDGLGLRARLEAHRAKAECATCHDRLDPIGFGLERYDAIGRWRDVDEDGKPIDDGGTLPSGATFRGPEELKQVFLARGRDVARCLCEHLLTYALGRGLEPYDAPTVDALVARLEREEWRFSSLVTGIVESYPFRWRRGARPQEEASWRRE